VPNESEQRLRVRRRATRRPRLPALRKRRQLTTTEVFVGSFAILILAGAIGLKWLPGLYAGEPLDWTNAFFTATSAVCVTGLIVVDTATYFTFRGQLFLLVLIQLGGLGMLTLTSMIISALGGRPSLRSETAAAATQTVAPHIPPRALIVAVFRFTFVFEALGALLLYVTWAPSFGWRAAIWPSVFHSVSAFCNAGFSLNTDSLMQFQRSPATIAIISALIIAGGLGFVTIEEIAQRFGNRKHRHHNMSIHSRLVIVTSLMLLGGAWILFAFFEWNEGLKDLSNIDKLANAFFLSVTPRTAGFNTVDYANLTNSANFLTILLMMIGGSPGSTAGGIKTTTFALLGLLAWSRLQASTSVTYANRSIPEETVQRAVGLVVVAVMIIVLGMFLVAGLSDLFDRQERFLVEMFEIVSAFNTVGLSMGMTPHLSTASRWVVILLMFAGRIGPLSLATVLRMQLARRGKYRYAHEDIVVG
jgi:trk system potassium uptake protein